jgi:hypothetical protein
MDRRVILEFDAFPGDIRTDLRQIPDTLLGLRTGGTNVVESRCIVSSNVAP